jgi:hypothetical protein
MYIKAEDKEHQKYYDFLEEVRQTGVANMFGAGRFLEIEFSLTPEEAKSILITWMKGHKK